MGRVVGAIKGMVVLGLAFHLHHRFHGPAVDYVGLAAAAFAGWCAVPGPGEPVLIAEAIFAAKHSLDISSVIAVAWIAAAAGGMVGWLVGLKAGRRLVTASGPFEKARMRALERGEEVFKRHPVFAIYVSPAWVSGILAIEARLYTLVNVATALVWATSIGLGAYYAGPPIVDLVGDAGTISEVGLVVLVVAAVGGEVLRRRRRAGTSESH